MKKEHRSSSDERLLWGIGFAAKTITGWIECFGKKRAEKMAREVEVKIVEEHAAGFRTAWGG